MRFCEDNWICQGAFINQIINLSVLIFYYFFVVCFQTYIICTKSIHRKFSEFSKKFSTNSYHKKKFLPLKVFITCQKFFANHYFTSYLEHNFNLFCPLFLLTSVLISMSLKIVITRVIMQLKLPLHI